jgi:hypothetical protein
MHWAEGKVLEMHPDRPPFICSASS